MWVSAWVCVFVIVYVLVPAVCACVRVPGCCHCWSCALSVSPLTVHMFDAVVRTLWWLFGLCPSWCWGLWWRCGGCWWWWHTVINSRGEVGALTIAFVRGTLTTTNKHTYTHSLWSGKPFLRSSISLTLSYTDSYSIDAIRNYPRPDS